MKFFKEWRNNKAMQEMHYLRMEDLLYQIKEYLFQINIKLANKELKGGREDGKE